MRLAWSHLAIAELKEIRRTSISRWGRAVAAGYIADLRDAAKRVAECPDTARTIQGHLRLVRARSHYLIVYVSEDTRTVTIARILHTAMEIERHLP